MLTKKIVKKGTSAFILIPSEFLKMLDLKLGDNVSLSLNENNIIISPTKKNEKVK